MVTLAAISEIGNDVMGSGHNITEVSRTPLGRKQSYIKNLYLKLLREIT